jgi:two-component system phosphate regulon sensor histidine kinase PhoR
LILKVASGIKYDLLRLVLVLAAALLAGLILGHVWLFLVFGLLAILIWYHRALQGFYEFIKHGADDNLIDMPGIINDLVREFEILRKHYLFREERLTGFLNRFEETTAALPDAVVVTALDGKIEWANKRAGNYLGIEWPRDSGQRISNLLRYPALVDHLKKENNELQSMPLEIVSPTDPERRLEIRVNYSGSASILFVARDITEIHRLNRVRKDFIANASHELRTPLTVIAGYLESFAEDEEECPPAWHKQLKQMREQADRMRRLIDDLLTLSGLESAEEPAPEEEVRVADMLPGIISAAKTLSGERNHVITGDLDDTVLLLGSHRDLYSAFSNLVFNAVQYTPAGGNVSVRWFGNSDGSASMQVQDTGEGIEEKHIVRITERFYRVDKDRSRSTGGTGLGLAIVKHVLLQHGARLDVQSRPGHGSTFTCWFPPERVVTRPAANDRSPASA